MGWRQASLNGTRTQDFDLKRIVETPNRGPVKGTPKSLRNRPGGTPRPPELGAKGSFLLPKTRPQISIHLFLVSVALAGASFADGDAAAAIGGGASEFQASRRYNHLPSFLLETNKVSPIRGTSCATKYFSSRTALGKRAAFFLLNSHLAALCISKPARRLKGSPGGVGHAVLARSTISSKIDVVSHDRLSTRPAYKRGAFYYLAFPDPVNLQRHLRIIGRVQNLPIV